MASPASSNAAVLDSLDDASRENMIHPVQREAN